MKNKDLSHFKSQAEKLNYFVVEGYEQLPQTFIRNDLRRMSAEQDWELLDILKYKKNYVKPNLETALIAFSSMVFIVRHFFKIAPLLFSCKYRTVVHALLLFTNIRRDKRVISSNANFKGHFLGKCAIVCYFFHLSNRSKYCLVCHGSDLYSSPAGYKILLKAADRIECVTYFGKGFVYGRLGKSALGRTFMIRNAISRLDEPQDDTPYAGEGLVGISVCRLVPQKDLEFCLRCISELKELLDTPISLKIVGDGPEKLNLEKLARKLKVEKEVIFVGALENKSAQKLMASSDFLILPCLEDDLIHADGLPVVFQEALSLGVPVFCRKAFGVSELCISGVNGYAFERTDTPEEWAYKIVEVLPNLNRSEIARLSRFQY